jgi:hypothetical protein
MVLICSIKLRSIKFKELNVTKQSFKPVTDFQFHLLVNFAIFFDDNILFALILVFEGIYSRRDFKAFSQIFFAISFLL